MEIYTPARFHRRNLLKAASFLLASRLSYSQGSRVHKVLGTTRLFDPISSSGVDLVQETLLLPDSVLLSLHGDPKSNRWAVTGADFSGTLLWSYPLPNGTYSGMTTCESGNAFVVHAFSAKYEGKSRRNCIFRLDKASGRIDLLGSTDEAGAGYMMRFAGDSYLLGAGSNSLKLWDVHNGLNLVADSVLAIANGVPLCHIDLIAPGLVSITPRTAESISILSIPGGTIRTIPLSSPKIVQSRRMLERLLASAEPLPPAGARALLGTLLITGANPKSKTLRALVMPVPHGEPIPMISIDMSGTISDAGAYQVALRSGPLKIHDTGTEIAIVNAHGFVNWYDA